MGELEVVEVKEIQTDWYQSLIDDCQSIMVEAEFTSRWVLVQGYHTLGLRILQENDNFEREKIYGKKIVQRVGESLGKSNQTIFCAIKFARKFPDLAALPEGKDTSWRKICNEYLPEHKEPNQPEFDENIETKHECPKCGYEW